MIVNEIFANFLSNSIKFTPKGKSISIMWRVTEEYVIIYLEDQGVGIEADFLENILNGGNAMTSVGTDGELGSGYGMQIALNSIKSMMGKYTIYSQTEDQSPLHFGTQIKVKLRKAEKTSEVRAYAYTIPDAQREDFYQ